MNRGFTLIEILVVIALVGLFISGIFIARGCSPELSFTLSEPKDIKVIVDPKTGEVSECIRPWLFGDWVCRPMKIKERPAERE